MKIEATGTDQPKVKILSQMKTGVKLKRRVGIFVSIVLLLKYILAVLFFIPILFDIHFVAKISLLVLTVATLCSCFLLLRRLGDYKIRAFKLFLLLKLGKMEYEQFYYNSCFVFFLISFKIIRGFSRSNFFIMYYRYMQIKVKEAKTLLQHLTNKNV